MTPEEKEQRQAALLEKIDTIERMFRIYHDSLPLGMNSTNQMDYEYHQFSFEKIQVVRGENFTFLAYCESSIRWLPREEKFLYFGVSNKGNPLETAIRVVSIKDFLKEGSESEYFEFIEEALLEIAEAVQKRYEECFNELSLDAKILVERLVPSTRHSQKTLELTREMLAEEKRRRTDAESRLFDLQNDAESVIQNLAATRTFVRSRAIGKIREDLERAVNESQIDKKYPPLSDRPNPRG